MLLRIKKNPNRFISKKKCSFKITHYNIYLYKDISTSVRATTTFKNGQY